MYYLVKYVPETSKAIPPSPKKEPNGKAVESSPKKDIPPSILQIEIANQLGVSLLKIWGPDGDKILNSIRFCLM